MNATISSLLSASNIQLSPHLYKSNQIRTSDMHMNIQILQDFQYGRGKHFPLPSDRAETLHF